MLIILTLYLVLVWLVFSKLKLLSWGWVSGTIAALIGAFILAVFLAMFNYLTPSGSFVVGSRVGEIAPNVSGQVTKIPVRPNMSVKAGTSPNGFRTIKPGAKVRLVFDDDPGRIHDATITAIPQGTGEGQIAVSGTLTRAGSIRGAKTYPALISIPKDIDHSQLRLGMPGTATVFADNAGVIGLLMSILVWIGSYTAFL
jgi:multidrug resistance efflux pump